MRKGFTLVELLVCIVIGAALLGLLVGGVRTCSNQSNSDTGRLFFETPEQQRNRIEAMKLEEMRRQNEEMRRQNELLLKEFQQKR